MLDHLLIAMCVGAVAGTAWALPAPTGCPHPRVSAPGTAFTPPLDNAHAEGVEIFSNSDGVAPDGTFVVCGRGLRAVKAWGPGIAPGGQPVAPIIHVATGDLLMATLPESAYDGLTLLWPGDGERWGAPIRLNAPDPWWATPDRARPGDWIHIFGRNLARRPDDAETFVLLLRQGASKGQWLRATDCDRYQVTAQLPSNVAPGEYQVWVHAGMAGEWGWGGPLNLRIEPRRAEPRFVECRGNTAAAIERAIARLGPAGGRVELSPGTYSLDHTLIVPAGVTLCRSPELPEEAVLQITPKAHLDDTAGVRSAVWLRGDGAGLEYLGILGTPATDTGVFIGKASGESGRLRDITVSRVRIADIGRKEWLSCAVRLRSVDYAVVRECNLTAQTPLLFEDVRQGQFEDNRLVGARRSGGGAEAAIMAWQTSMRECIVADNTIGAPEPAGGPGVRRMIWVSSGRGSIDHNCFARNRTDRVRFAGVAGTEENVGETIMPESNMRIAWYGPIAAAEAASITLPPDGPFHPPVEPAPVGEEPPLTEYFVTVVKGRGLGQCRRVVGKDGGRLLLDRPWRVAPDASSLVVMRTDFVRNLILDNEVEDGMTGLQLWIGGSENVFARNHVARERRQGVLLYAAMTTQDHTMPRTWNRGIGPLYYNLVEGNSFDETALAMNLSINAEAASDWPLAMGNVFRYNSAANSRTSAFSAGVSGEGKRLCLGTIAEFNMVRDQSIGFAAGKGTAGTVLRRNHVYFWRYEPGKPVAFDVRGAEDAVVADNEVEGVWGGPNPSDIILQQGP
jgi:hypothetical protein